MKNPIARNDMFATPENIDALLYNGEQFSGRARTAFTLGMMLTWNYLSAQLDKQEPHSITLLMGDEAARRYSDGEDRPCRLSKIGDINSYSFSSKEDLDTALNMLFDYDGWQGWVEFEPKTQTPPEPTDGFDAARAHREGWGVFDTKDGLRIERLDEAEIFDSDSNAWHFIVTMALKGSRYHRKALQIIADNNRAERDEIHASTGYDF